MEQIKGTLAKLLDDLIEKLLRQAENQPVNLESITDSGDREHFSQWGKLDVETALTPCPSEKAIDRTLWNIRRLKAYGAPRAQIEAMLNWFCVGYTVDPEIAFDIVYPERLRING